jgi:hypothetical protein
MNDLLIKEKNLFTFIERLFLESLDNLNLNNRKSDKKNSYD